MLKIRIEISEKLLHPAVQDLIEDVTSPALNSKPGDILGFDITVHHTENNEIYATPPNRVIVRTETGIETRHIASLDQRRHDLAIAAVEIDSLGILPEQPVLSVLNKMTNAPTETDNYAFLFFQGAVWIQNIDAQESILEPLSWTEDRPGQETVDHVARLCVRPPASHHDWISRIEELEAIHTLATNHLKITWNAEDIPLALDITMPQGT